MALDILIIAPAPPPFGGMANQAQLLAQCLAKEKVNVSLVATNQVPSFFSEKFWKVPVIRSIGKFSMYAAGTIRALNHCTAIHILACSHTYFYLNVLPAVLAGHSLNKKVIVNYRGGEAEQFFKGLARFFLWLFRLTDALVVPSQYLQTVFHNLGLQAVIIPNISEIERFHFRLPDYTEKIRFICTRNFEEYYDIITLIRAFHTARKQLPGASLTLIGEGSLKNSIAEYIKKNGLTDCVAFAGRVDPSDMPIHLESHDIYVNSSVVDNYPISLLEAFSSGLPVISTAAGGIPYMIAHGKTGILVQPKDPTALAEEMICLASDLDHGRTLATNAKAFADEHSWETIWQKLKEQYR